MKELLLERPNLFFIAKRDYFTLIAAIVVSLSILFNNDKPQIDAMRAFLIDRFASLQMNISRMRNLIELNRQNEALRWRATHLMLENCQLREALLENQRLRQMLHYRERMSLDFRAARVIAKEREKTPAALTIDIGEEDGIRPNMAVVNPEGLVGKIYKVTQHTSIVQLMLDQNFSVSARVQRSRVLGIGTYSEKYGLQLSAVPRHSDVRKEDAVVVSDSSALFPPGIRIGHVTEAENEKNTFFMRIRLEPEVDFSRLEEVFVITSPAAAISN